MPLVRRTRATFRSAEFGFLGVCVNTRTHTPRFCGLLCKAGLFVLLSTASRPFLTSWLIVGINARAQMNSPVEAHASTGHAPARRPIAAGAGVGALQA